MATEAELKEIVRNHNGGEWLVHYGPMQIGSATVYEVWTRDKATTDWAPIFRKGEMPQTRFFLEDENGQRYFDYFCDLSKYLDKSESANNAPADLTVGQLIRGLKPTELWAVLGAIILVIGCIFYLGAKLGSLFGW